MVKISIVMQSYLGAYKGAASNREAKILRAVESVQAQTYENTELIVIADGCHKTKELVKDAYLIPKQELWSGVPRNEGIKRATGDYIIYLDIDDVLTPEHCAIIAERASGDLVFMPDYFYTGKDKKTYIPKPERSQFSKRPAVMQQGYCGTSNIIHRNNRAVWWEEQSNYAHDWRFINRLINRYQHPEYLNESGYLVCHIPNKFDV